MISFLAKWLGFKALKAGFKKILLTTVVKPFLTEAVDYIHEAVDDPTTQLDDQAADKVEEYLHWLAEKKLNQLI